MFWDFGNFITFAPDVTGALNLVGVLNTIAHECYQSEDYPGSVCRAFSPIDATTLGFPGGFQNSNGYGPSVQVWSGLDEGTLCETWREACYQEAWDLRTPGTASGRKGLTSYGTDIQKGGNYAYDSSGEWNTPVGVWRDTIKSIKECYPGVTGQYYGVWIPARLFVGIGSNGTDYYMRPVTHRYESSYVHSSTDYWGENKAKLLMLVRLPKDELNLVKSSDKTLTISPVDN